jgi:hypothetical protein
LQVGNPEPLHISALMWGDIHTERALHARFAEGRLMGEWFRRDTPGLQELITEAIGLEYLLYAEHARRCVQCGRPYDSLRTKLCSDECERQRKIETSRRWRRNRRAELST